MKRILHVNGQEYRVRKLLGKGKGGYSYLADAKGKPVVVKQIHHEPCDYYQFGDKLQAEYQDYLRLREIGIAMPEMLDLDKTTERIVKQYIPGDTVYDMVRKDVLPDTCMHQMKEMCRLLYRSRINIDYFPTNFILHEGVLYYVDYECNEYREEWNFENWGIKYWSKTAEFLKYAAEHP